MIKIVLIVTWSIVEITLTMRWQQQQHWQWSQLHKLWCSHQVSSSQLSADTREGRLCLESYSGQEVNSIFNLCLSCWIFDKLLECSNFSVDETSLVCFSLVQNPLKSPEWYFSNQPTTLQLNFLILYLEIKCWPQTDIRTVDIFLISPLWCVQHCYVWDWMRHFYCT